MSLPDRPTAIELDTVRHQADDADTIHLQPGDTTRRYSDYSSLEAVQDQRSSDTADQPVPIASHERVSIYGHTPEKSPLHRLE